MEKLEKVRIYEKKRGELIPEKQRPAFHVTPEAGWMNDPNGFSMYKGEVHLFFQYYPYDVHWGPMHWAHVKTQDFIKWNRLPAALAPDQPYESGCYSGSAAELEDGRQMLMYTAHLETTDPETGRKSHTETQCVAFGDGVDYQKYEHNPVITSELLPDGFSKAEFRDPKFWKDEDGFHVVMVGEKKDGNGAIVLCHSEDGLHWSFGNVLDENDGNYGKMWECPDFFELDGKNTALTSPMEMFTEGLEFHNGHGTIYAIGEYEKTTGRFKRDKWRTMDYGLDFYAPQTMETEDGRRIMIAWMECWDNYMTPNSFDWSGMMTIPRELRVKNGRLYQNPVKELEKYHSNPQKYEDFTLKTGENKVLDAVNGRILDMTVEVTDGNYEHFTVHVAADEKYHTDITYNRQDQTVTLSRKYSGLAGDTIDNRSFYVEDQHGKITLRFVMDRYSVELFVNEGAQAASSLIYTRQSADGISFETDGELTMNVSKADIVL